MKLKFSPINVVACLLLAGAVFLWGPGFDGLARSCASVALYALIFCGLFCGNPQIKKTQSNR